MMIKKYLLSLFLIFVLISAFVMPASAAGAVFSLTTDDVELKNGETFEVIVAVNNIEVETGIVLVEYKIDFDFNCFEIVEWHHNVPSAWDGRLEDISTVWDKEGEKYFKSSYCYSEGELGHGVTDDNELFTTITFKVISEDTSENEIKLYDAVVSDDNMKAYVGNDDSVAIDFFETQTVDSSTESSDIDMDTSDIVSTENTSPESDDSNNIQDLSDSSDINANGFDNLFKIAIAVVAALLIVAFSFWLNKFLKNKKLQETK